MAAATGAYRKDKIILDEPVDWPEGTEVPNRIRCLMFFATLLLIPYSLTYLYVSRQGYADADRYGMKGFYYVFPENTDSWRRWNYGCVYLFAPLNIVDRELGSGRYPAGEPFWGFGPHSDHSRDLPAEAVEGSE